MRITLGQLRRLIHEVMSDKELDALTIPEPNLSGASLTPTNDVDAEYNALSPEEKRSWDIQIYSDIYKEKHGIRPRWMYDELAGMTDEQFQKEMKWLEDQEGEWDDARKMWGDDPDPGAPYPESEMFADDPALNEPDPWDEQPKGAAMKDRMRSRRTQAEQPRHWKISKKYANLPDAKKWAPTR